MIVPNIINPEKRGKILSTTFHVFFMDDATAALFDRFMDVPIIYGNKTIVKETVRRLKDHLPAHSTRVRIFFYKISPPEFKMKMKYEGLTSKIVIPNF